jgi:hypothetical protein
MSAMRWLLLVLLLGCGSHKGGPPDAAIDAGYTPDACDDLSCYQVNCADKGLPPTTISGIVHAPNGTLPLYGVDVYVPRSDPGPLASGVQCGRCDVGLQGGSHVQTRTDEHGRFVLEDVPATTDVPLVIQIGKWRRQITIPNVAACQTLDLPAVDTRLPKNASEGDLPQIALSTGGADSLECFLLKLGIDPAEIGTGGEATRVHLYTNVGIGGQGTNKFAATHPGGARNFADSKTLWGSEAELDKYDILILSCEGGHYPNSKPQTSMNAMKAYADKGGRMFLSHWHGVWVEGAAAGAGGQKIQSWSEVATWNHTADLPNPSVDYIDEVSNPKGVSFADWMVNVGGSPVMRTYIPVTQGQRTCRAVDPAKGERWVYWTDGNPLNERTQNFQFTTPIELEPEARCGKVVFSDMHVSAGSTSNINTSYPNGCSNTGLSPQEKALAFMFFDIASCVGTIF